MKSRSVRDQPLVTAHDVVQGPRATEQWFGELQDGVARRVVPVGARSQARTVRGKVVEDHELEDGTVKTRHRSVDRALRCEDA